MGKRRYHSLESLPKWLWIVTALLTFSAAGLTQDLQMHQRGKKYIRERKWQRAIETYNRLVKEYPASLYADDARFWEGFSLEQLPGKERESFQRYQRVIDEYPNSPWVDDAIVHQIFLSKKMSRMGDTEAGRFLLEKIEDPNSMIRQQAALALGELRDPAALPILEEIARGEDRDMAREAMQALEEYSEMLEVAIAESLKTSGPEAFERSGDTAVKSGRVLNKLLKSGGEWTEQELLMNGLYHVVPQEDLEFYLSLENDWDRSEWWRKLWASRDPTPTTEHNEAEEEFRRRVRYAWEYYGREWEYDNFFYPPWDSRGEVYIKLGNPDERDMTDRADYEKWIYYRYRIGFLVSNRMPNRFGDGVYLSPVTTYLYRSDLDKQLSYYIRKPRFMFEVPELETVKKFKNFQLELVSGEHLDQQVRVRYQYSFPSQNLRFRMEKDAYVGTYRTRWVVFDEDYEVLSSSDAVDEFILPEGADMKEGVVEGAIELSFVPGSYVLAMRIEDLYSNKMGIYRKKFSIKGRGMVKEVE